MKTMAVLLLLTLMTAVVLARASGVIVDGADVVEQMGYTASPALAINIPPRIIVDGAGTVAQFAYTSSPTLTIAIQPRVIVQQAGVGDDERLVRPDTMLSEIDDPRYRIYLPSIVE